MTNDKKKGIFSFISNIIKNVNNVFTGFSNKAKEISSNAFNFFKEKAKNILEKLQKNKKAIEKTKIDEDKLSDSEAEALLKSKKILFEIKDGIISLAEGREGQYLIFYIQFPDAKVPVFFSPSFVNAKEWVARNGVAKANKLLLKRLTHAYVTLDYVKKVYVVVEEYSKKTKKLKRKVKQRMVREIKSDRYDFSNPVYNMDYKDIAYMVYSYMKSKLDSNMYTSKGSGFNSDSVIIDMRLYIE
jgi:hypothetical protein